MDSGDGRRAAAVAAFSHFLRRRRWAAFGTIGKHGPEVSWVAYATHQKLSQGIILHLSQLASHTRNLERTPTASLSVSEHEIEADDPQRLARFTLTGVVATVATGSRDFQRAVDLYRTVLPDSLPRFDFKDFRLYRFVPTAARFVAGFAQAYTIRGDDLDRV